MTGYRPTCQLCGAPLDYSRVADGQILGACGRRWQLLPDGRGSSEWRMRPAATAIDPEWGSCPDVTEGSPRW